MDVVLASFVDGVYTITLNRPEKKNAMSLELLKRFAEAVDRVETEGARIVLIRGAGKTFCAGGDILEFRESAQIEVQIDGMADYLHRGIQKIRQMSAIVIAVVGRNATRGDMVYAQKLGMDGRLLWDNGIRIDR